MAQNAQAAAHAGIVLVRQTEQPPPGGEMDPTGGLGSPTTLLLLMIGAAFLWWNMRRRRAFEERLREQRRQENIAHAEQSAQNVAVIMRQKASPEAAAAAATEGLASAARMPAPESASDRLRGGPSPDAAETNGTGVAAHGEAHARMLNQAEAAATEAAAEEEARLASRAAERTGTENARRAAAATEAAAEAEADTMEARGGPVVARDRRERESQAALRAGLHELERETEPPLGAIAGDGTAICPPDFPVKGVVARNVYHGPGQPGYPAALADFCFASTEAAEAAGFQRDAASQEGSSR